MKYLHEYVQHLEGLPIRIFIHNQSYVPQHWHKDTEILLILAGKVTIITSQEHFELHEDDIVIINSDEIHSTILNEGNSLIVVGIQIDPAFCSKYSSKNKTISFAHDTFLYTETNMQKARVMRYFMARLVWETMERGVGFQFTLEGMTYLLLSWLIRNCEYHVIEKTSVERTEVELQRLRPILDYIDANYAQRLSLKKIADQKYISFYYLSHMFKAKMGVSFQEYLNGIRLVKALQLLVHSDRKIVDIIYECGFSGPKFFYRYFKENQHCTPVQYRKNHRPVDQPETSSALTTDYNAHSRSFITQIDLVLTKLLSYLESSQHDRRFNFTDKNSLISRFRENARRKPSYFATPHFIVTKKSS